MTSDSSNNAFDADPPARDAAPLGLPRLQVIHLMLWMAATAIAFLPYQMQRLAQVRLSPGAEVLSPSVSATAMGTMRGLAAGSYLFVTAALWYWKLRGYMFRLQPGHWFAFEGVGQWIMATGTWLLLIASEGPPFGAFPLFMFPRLIVGFVFFFLFMRLALRSQEPPRWRWTYAAIALSPIATWLLTMAAMFTIGMRGQVGAFMIPNAAAAVSMTLFFLVAITGDWRSHAQRHWSHWLGAGMRLVVLAASAVMYTYYSLNPLALTGG
jgi:hypothetical protein